MAQYRVSHVDGDGVALHDAAGRCHFARALHEVPPVGTELHGVRARPGFAILSVAASQRTCRVIFEAIDRSPHEVLSGPLPQ